jgi:pimeloyl-ACP methyl ester carboxylesterase
MGTTTQLSWHAFAKSIAARGISALTFDFRGMGRSVDPWGRSTPENPHPDSRYADTRGAIRFLREQGFSRIACVGASLGGIGCTLASLGEDLAGLVVIASPAEVRVLEQQYPEDLVSPTMPKLFVVAEEDRYSSVVRGIPRLYEVSPEPKEIRIFPGTAHGTELFSTEYGEEFSELLVGFLEGLR